MVFPLRFQKIDLAVEYKRPVYLFSHDAERLARLELKNLKQPI